MSDTSESLTPSQENLANMNDVRTYEAIDNLMQKEEQTYDDFLNGFTYLKKEDLLKQTKKQPLNKVHDKSHNSNFKMPVASGDSVTQKTSVNINLEDSDLEEEVLESGTTSNMMSKSAEVKVNSSVKFDNFVDAVNEDLSDEDEIGDGGYVSSFGNEQDKVSTERHSENSDKFDNPIKTEVSKNVFDVVPGEKDEPQPDLLNPGEVEVSEDIPNLDEVQTDRCLDFSTKIRENSSGTTQSSNNETTEICTDEVEPFSLDESFDYDNVILTPKFSEQEVNYLKSVMQQNDVT